MFQKTIKCILACLLILGVSTQTLTVHAEGQTPTHTVSYTNHVKDGDGRALKAFIAFRLVDLETGNTKEVTETYGGMYFKDGITSPEHSEYYRGTKYYYDSKNYRLYEFEPNETININIPVGTALEAIEFCYETEFSSQYYYSPYVNLHGTKKLLVQGTDEDLSSTISDGDFKFNVNLDKIEQKSPWGQSEWRIDEDYTSVVGLPENLVSVSEGGDIDFGSWSLSDANWGERNLKITLSISEIPGNDADIMYDDTKTEVELLYTSEGKMGGHKLTGIKYTKVDGEIRTEVSGISFINYTQKAEEDDDLSGGTAKLKKYLVLNKDTEVPNAEFVFNISAGNAIESQDGYYVVYAGKNPEKVKINNTAKTGKVVFIASEATQNGALDDVASSDEKYVMKNIVLDFSDVKFDEPGVYRYILEESVSTKPYIINDPESIRVVDVHVAWNDDETELIVDGYVGYYGEVDSAPKLLPDFEYEYVDTDDDGEVSNEEKEAQKEAYETAYNEFISSIQDGSGKPDGSYVNADEPIEIEAGEKSDKYVNKVKSSNLSLIKEVKGNQGSKNEYFEFEISITNGGKNSVLTLDMSEAEDGVTHENEATVYKKVDMDAANQKDDDKGENGKPGQQIILDENGASTFKIYLQHGQKMKLFGLLKGTEYTITETAAPGYKTTSENEQGTIAETDVEAKFINERSGVIPTGLLINVSGPLIVGGVMIIWFVLKNKKKEVYE